GPVRISESRPAEFLWIGITESLQRREKVSPAARARSRRRRPRVGDRVWFESRR
ncbi:unnamed protein product, partial [Ascophyllum nodosum]